MPDSPPPDRPDHPDRPDDGPSVAPATPGPGAVPPSARHRGLIVTGAMLGTFLVAVDVTIVDTVMPKIIGSLGGFSLFTWVISAYLITSTATVPVYGRMADLFGRKRVFVTGAGLFVLGSVLCGLAGTMAQLILFRALQGLGAGAVLPVTQTLIGDMFSPPERARMQGYFSAVWGISGTAGPVLGGLLADLLSWRWIFFINLPLGIAAIATLAYALRWEPQPRRVAVDYGGFVTLTAGITLLLLGLLTGGIHWPWGSPQVVGLLGAASLVLAVFVAIEMRHPHPMVPFGLFRRRTVAVPMLANVMSGAIVIGVAVYLPLLVQGVYGGSATVAGLVLAPLSVTWPIASFLSGRMMLRFGYRRSAVGGMAVNVVAALGLWIMIGYAPAVPLWAVTAMASVLGIGMGFSLVAFLLLVQNDVAWEERGIATASLQFVRNLGRTIGVAVMGTIVNLTLLAQLDRIPGLGAATGAGRLGSANQLLDPEQWVGMAPELLAEMRIALATAMTGPYLLMLVLAVAGFGITLFLPQVEVRQGQVRPRP